MKNLRVMLCLLLTLLLPTACARQPQSARIEEITFQSGRFDLVGELRTPAGTSPFPVVLFVHGDTPTANRTMLGIYLPIMERMLQAGYTGILMGQPRGRRIDGHDRALSNYQPAGADRHGPRSRS